MTVATTQIAEAWTGDASSVTFPIPFPFLSRDHLVVWKEDAESVRTYLTVVSATGEGESSGGSITLSDPVGVGYALHVRRHTPRVQETDYVPHDPFPADSHERALDKLTMIVQELEGGTGTVFDVDGLRKLVGDSAEIVWNFDEEHASLLGSLVWPLKPPAGDYIDAPSSIYKRANGGMGYGSDTLTAKSSIGADTRHGIELAYSGSAGTVRVGDIDGTRLEYADNVGGTGVDAHGYGVHAFDGLIVGELADAEADPIRPATIGVSGRIGAAKPDDFRKAIGAPGGTGDSGQVVVWTGTTTQGGSTGLTAESTGAVVDRLRVGNGTQLASAYFSADAPGAYGTFFRMYSAGVLQARFGRSGSNIVLDAYDAAGVDIDSPWSMPIAAGGVIAMGGFGATKRDVNLTKDLKFNGITRITNGGAATLTSALVTALAHGTSGEWRLTASDYLGNVTYRTAAQARADIGAAASTDLASYQPLDSDLTAIAALSTTTFGRSLLTQADASAARTTLALNRNAGREWSIYPTARISFADSRYSQLAYSGVVFVQVVKDTVKSLYRYSSNGLTWTESNMPVSANWTDVVWCSASSLFIAVGYANDGSGLIYTSPNGVTWTSRTTTATYLYGVAVKGGTVVACSNGGQCVRSTDGGLTWALISPSYYNLVYFANGYFFLVNSSRIANGTIKSSDGSSWDSPVTHEFDIATVYSDSPFAYFNGKHWVGQDSILYAAGDGKNYTPATSSSDFSAPSSITKWECLAATPEAMFAVVEYSSGKRSLLRTNDGLLWETVGPCGFFQYGSMNIANVAYLPSSSTLFVTGYLPTSNFSAFAYA